MPTDLVQMWWLLSLVCFLAGCAGIIKAIDRLRKALAKAREAQGAPEPFDGRDGEYIEEVKP